MKKFVALLTAVIMVIAIGLPVMAENYRDDDSNKYVKLESGAVFDENETYFGKNGDEYFLRTGTTASQPYKITDQHTLDTAITGTTTDRYGVYVLHPLGKNAPGTITQIEKYLLTDAGTDVPNVEFQYTLSLPEVLKEGGQPVKDGDLEVAVRATTLPAKFKKVETGAAYDSSITYYSNAYGRVSDINSQEKLDAAIAIDAAYIADGNDTYETPTIYVGILTDVEGNKQAVYLYDSTVTEDTAKYAEGNKNKGLLIYSERDNSNRKQKDAADKDKGQTYITSAQQYNKKQLNIDFSKIRFTEPGIYRYYLNESIIQEDNSIPEGLFNMDKGAAEINKKWRTIDVYVQNVKNDDDKDELKIDSETGVYPYSYVIYEGKLTGTEVPYADISAYNPTANKARLPYTFENTAYTPDSVVVWRFPYEYANEYAKAKKEGRDYDYDPEHYDYFYDLKDGGWVEVYTDSDGNVTVQRNVTTKLNEAYAALTTELQPTNAGEALEMGAQQVVMTLYESNPRTWTYTYPEDSAYPNMVRTRVWDPAHKIKPEDDAGAWHLTSRREDTVNVLPDDVKAYEGTTEGLVYINKKNGEKTRITGNNTEVTLPDGTKVTVKNEYADLIEKLDIAPYEIQKYTWIREATPTGYTVPVTETYTYENNKWKVVETTDTYQYYEENGKVTIRPEAVPNQNQPIKISLIQYPYGERLEKEAQEREHYTYDALLSDPDNNYSDAGIKNSVFINEYETVELKIQKNVTGNQGSRDKYFKFTLHIEKENAKSLPLELDITHLDHDASTVTKNAATTYTIDTIINANKLSVINFSSEPKEGTENVYVADHTFYLQSGDYIVIKGLPSKTQYSVDEFDKNSEGYKTTANLTRASTGEKKYFDGTKYVLWDSAQEKYVDGNVVTIKEGNHFVLFINDKVGVIPTGVAIGIGAGAILLGIVVVYIVIRRRRYAYEDEE